MDLWKLARSLVAGAAATLADLGALAVLVSVAGLAPRVASLPALVAGGAVQFFGNRRWVFRAENGSLPRQVILFVLVEAIALGLNALFYDGAMHAVSPHLYLAARLVTSNLVYVIWSYPMWHFVFGVERRPR